jgi:hypothetical protein
LSIFVKKFAKSCQKSYQKVVKSFQKSSINFSKNCQKVVKQVGKKAKRCQKIVNFFQKDAKTCKKLTKSHGKPFKRKSQQRVGFGWGYSSSKAFGISAMQLTGRRQNNHATW